ncbi:hypothetical protein QYF36_008519 [Acer negundo]|nr:hypothetical protein QYF36_008519 [Acer negundo]
MSAETNWHFVFCADLFKQLHFSVFIGSNDVWDDNVQISDLMQPSSTQNWLSSQSSSSRLIVKREIGVDIPIDKYPNVLLCPTALPTAIGALAL